MALKTEQLLESETKPWLIDEQEYSRRTTLDRCLKHHIFGVDRKTEKPYLNKEQQIVLKEYFEFLLSQKATMKSQFTILSKIKNIHLAARAIPKPFSEIKKQELISYFASLQTGEHNLATSSILLKQLHIRQFFQWLYNDKNAEVISWIKGLAIKKNKLDPNQLLTSLEIKRMVETTNNKRDSCLIMLCYECGLRIGEVISIKIKNVKHTDNGFIIRVNGKTGERDAFVIDGEPYIREWLNEHPFKSNPEAPLFIGFSYNEYGRQLLRQGIYKIIIRAAKIAGIDKHVHPHLLRHSILNSLGKQGFKERDLRIFAGWSGSSNMPDVYLHYGSEEVEKKLLKLKGKYKEEDKIKEETENKQLEPRVCPRCNKINPATAVYCNCGMALDKKTWINDTERREEADSKLNELFADDEFKNLVKDYLKKKSEGAKNEH